MFHTALTLTCQVNINWSGSDRPGLKAVAASPKIQASNAIIRLKITKGNNRCSPGRGLGAEPDVERRMLKGRGNAPRCVAGWKRCFWRSVRIDKWLWAARGF